MADGPEFSKTGGPWRRFRSWPIGAQILVTILLIVGVGALANDEDNVSTTKSVRTETTSSLRTVVYEVTGTATSASLTMAVPGGGTSQLSVPVPFVNQTGKPGLTHQFRSGEFVYLSAQNRASSGSITCTIKVDGVVKSTTTSHGGYTIATCQDVA